MLLVVTEHWHLKQSSDLYGPAEGDSKQTVMLCLKMVAVWFDSWVQNQ